jgi:hypothetical protein
MKQLILVFLIATLASFKIPSDIRQSTGKITMLRVHDVGTRYGPPTDQIDAEVIIQLNSQADKSYGFKLRNDSNSFAREGMLNLLRDAFAHDWSVTVDYNIEPGKNNGTIIRVWVKK